MKIILVGGGKVGTALARQLSEEDHNVTIVDTNKARVEHLTESYDVLGIVGNGSSITTLAEAGIEDADVFIAVTGSDELNLLCCITRGHQILIPRGGDQIQVGDNVIVVTLEHGLHDLRDILDKGAEG